MNRSMVLPGGIAAAIVLWMLSGSFSAGSEPSTEASAEQTQETAFKVRAQVIRASKRATTLNLRGRTEAVRTLNLRAETSGRVVALPAQEGTIVEADAVICELDVREREARLEEAKASVRQRQMEFKAAEDLSGRGFRSETQAAGARAALEQARADLRERELDLGNTRIAAPFPALLDLYEVEIGTLMQTGDICAVLVDQDPFLVVAQVSEREVGRLSTGRVARARLVTGEQVEGRIRLIGTRADQATRTFRVEIEIPNPERRVFRDGVTADITIPLDEVPAHRISPALLGLNSAGDLGVRILKDGDVVHFAPVSLLVDEGDGVWVTGLPDTVTVITVGQDYVVEGQRVAVELADRTAEPGALARPEPGPRKTDPKG